MVPQAMIKMIATDMDGTFLRDDKKFDREAFNQLQQQIKASGIKFVIASGNQYQHLQDVFDDRQNELTYISDNGALIVSQGKTIAQNFISHQSLSAALSLLETESILKNALIVLSGRKDAYMSVNAPVDFYREAQRYYRHVSLITDFTQIKDDYFKIALAWFDRSGIEQEALLKSKLTDVHVTSSGYGGIDIIPANINKGIAIEQLQKYWQITPQETVAFGDNNNDLELLKSCELSFAMKNANDLIKQVANFETTYNNNDDGVLKQVRQLLDHDSYK